MAGNLIAIAMRGLQAVGPITAALPEFKAMYDQFVDLVKKPADQETLRKAYDELLAENTGGHARLDEMLRRAEQVPGSATDLTHTKVAGTGRDVE